MELIRPINWVTVLLCVLLISLGFIAALGMLGFTGQIKFGRDAPAWVQAVGSVVAIFVAIIVPVMIHSRERAVDKEKDTLRARGFALTVLPLAENFLRQLRSAKNTLNEESDDMPEFNDAARAAGVPIALQKMVQELHILGEPAAKMQNAIAYTSIARQHLEYMDFYYSHGGRYDHQDGYAPEELPEPDNPEVALDAAISRLTSAIQAMNEMFD